MLHTGGRTNERVVAHEENIFETTEDLNNRLQRYKERFLLYKNIVFWGAGKDAGEAVSYLHSVLKGKNVAIIDEDRSKHGLIWGRYHCYAPKWLLDNYQDDTIIVIASSLNINSIYREICDKYNKIFKGKINVSVCKEFILIFRWYKDSFCEEDISLSYNQDWASLPIDDKSNYQKIIRIFDEGYNAIYFTDRDGRYRYTLSVKNFYVMDRVPYGNITYDQMIYSDRASMDKAAKYVFKTKNITEFPCVNGDGKIVCSIRKQAESETDLLKKQHFVWEIIDKEIAKEFFGDKKVLLSSDCSTLKHFYNYFSGILQLSFFQPPQSGGAILNECVLYGSDIWLTNLKYDVFSVYLELLWRTTAKWLDSNNIHHCIVGTDGLVDNVIRIKQEPSAAYIPLRLQDEVYKNGIYISKLSDCQENGMNIIAGNRFTAHQPEKYVNTVYCYGLCTAFGASVRDENTLESCLQDNINTNKIPLRVVNSSCGVFRGRMSIINNLYILLNTKFKQGDIVIIIDFLDWFMKDSYVFQGITYRLCDIFNNEVNKSLRCFIDRYWGHFDEIGNKAVADFLYNIIKKTYVSLTDNKRVPALFIAEIENEYNVSKELNNYLINLQQYRVDFQNIGAIVMNGNPFTKGHRYLVEYASNQVDFLYLFIVQEDCSEFAFKDRLAMAKINCHDLKNVCVLPSGKYMISALTFGEYFYKKALQNQTVIPIKDVRIFGKFIAPKLNITKRFVGEEPFDRVTAQYNKVMKEVLPGYGIELVEIDRAQEGADIISASKVRELLSCGNIARCRSLLTDATWNYLREYDLFVLSC